MYDYQILMNQKYGGISRYFFQLVKGFKGKKDVDVVLPIKLSQNYYFRDFCSPNIKKATRLFVIPNCIKTLLVYCKYEFSGKKIDIIHPTYFYPSYYYFLPFWKRKKTKLVITVHDLIFEKYYPEIEKFGKNRRKRIIEKCDGIIVISYNTKKDLLEMYPSINPDKVEVIYPGIELGSKMDIKPIDAPAKYVLYVGERMLYKNANCFINAMAKIISLDKEIFAVFAGGKDFSEDEILLMKELNIYENVIHFKPSDEQLKYLYKNAICFVYPSLYEGFGIPILEAFESECPVLLHNGSCFPEIAKEAALYFDGNSSEDLSEKLNKIIYDPFIRQHYIEKGLEKVKEYSIINTIDATLSFYERLILK